MISIDLSGKIALVTGASSDLGKVMIAARLAEAGADVAIHYHSNKARAEKIGAEIAKFGRRYCLVTGDVTDEASVKAMKEVVLKELGAPDIIVTNANTGGSSWKLVLEQSVEGYANQFRGCVIQNVLMAQAFVPGMIEKKWGRIIAISTECVMQVQPTQSNYVVGKKGMDGLLRVLSKEIGMHGITVNQVAPGWTISERDRVAGTEKNEDYFREACRSSADARILKSPMPFSFSQRSQVVLLRHRPFICPSAVLT